ncbi:MAG TPA: hypothetical protein VGT98_13795 [Candidatus Elarobacter sp.]|nr:hypothetical protein [Candidatus Elarobacter sp.]
MPTLHRFRPSGQPIRAAACRGALALATAALCVACAEVPAAFGPTPTAARVNADALFSSFSNRFTNVARTPRYARAREVLGRNALTPSGIFADTSIWTAYEANDTHTLFGDASFSNGRYVFSNVPTNAPLDNPGDGRHVMRLHRISDNEFDWFTGVDFAVGSTITANDFANVITRWLASAEGRDAATLHANYRSAFPRTTAALGKLYSLDTLISVRDAEGANNLYLGIHIDPEGLRATLPAYADYMDKYARRVKLRFSLVDSRGAKWVDVGSTDGYITMRLRTKDGHFMPLEGALRPIPDTLAIKLDMTAKIKIFTVGVERMTGEWVNLHGDHNRGWALRFTKEPSWVLPPAMGHLIKSSLRKPFEGNGTQFRFEVRDQPGRQTLMTRRGTTTVQESAVLRFVGKLGGTAMGEFVSTAEEQENRFNAEVFNAMRADIDARLR